MKGKNKIQWYSIILLVFCMTACQVKRPDTVLSDSKMENLLYDFHIAKAIGEDVSYDESYKRVLYVEYIFKKHGVTQSDFDSSMVWFARNPEVLSKIYEKVNVRLKTERDNINDLIALRENKPKESLPGDSIDVWAWQHSYQLTGMPLDNKISFTLPSDSNFKDKDTLKWTVHFRFLNGKPDLNPLMAMQIIYEKDTISNTLKIKKTGTQTLSLVGDTLGKIKEIRGFIYYPMQKSIQNLLADGISLMRYHTKDSVANTKTDTLKTIVADSLKEKKTATDSVLKEGLHKQEQVRPRPSLREQENQKERQETKPIIR